MNDTTFGVLNDKVVILSNVPLPKKGSSYRIRIHEQVSIRAVTRMQMTKVELNWKC